MVKFRMTVGKPINLGPTALRILPRIPFTDQNGGGRCADGDSWTDRNQLKTLQEIITLLVFGVFSVLWLGETLRWNHMVAFMFLCGAAFFSFHKWS